jgi:hypothetical protein
MTLARDERTENCRGALKLMLEQLGDEPVDEVFFKPKDLEGVLRTSLDELQSWSFVEQSSPAGEFNLTGRGWISNANLKPSAGGTTPTAKALNAIHGSFRSFMKAATSSGFGHWISSNPGCNSSDSHHFIGWKVNANSADGDHHVESN